MAEQTGLAYALVDDRVADTLRRLREMTVLMPPEMANFAGHAHGGTILKFLDHAGYACV